MDLRQLEYIVAIADEKSITRAAEQFFISQSALSQQVSKLEKQLGTMLFRREKHELIPTHAGEIYIKAARQILAIRDEAYNDIKEYSKKNKKTIQIGTAPGRSTVLFSKIFTPFVSQYPNYNLSLVESPSTDVEKHLLQGKLNLVITLVSSNEEKELPFEFEMIRREPMYLITPANNPVAGKLSARAERKTRPSVSISDLAEFRDYHFALPARMTKLRKYIDEITEANDISLNVSYETLNTSNICLTVEDGSLCTIVSAGFIPNNNQNITVMSLGDGFFMDYGIAWPKGHKLSDQEKYVIELCKKHSVRK